MKFEYEIYGTSGMWHGVINEYDEAGKLYSVDYHAFNSSANKQDMLREIEAHRSKFKECDRWDIFVQES